MIGKPALGSTLTNRGQFWQIYRTVSVSSYGPNAQFSPSTSTSSNGSNAATSALASEPVSICCPFC